MNYGAINTTILQESIIFNEAKTEAQFLVKTTPNVVGNPYHSFLKEEDCTGVCTFPMATAGMFDINAALTAAQTFATSYVNTKYPNT